MEFSHNPSSQTKLSLWGSFASFKHFARRCGIASPCWLLSCYAATQIRAATAGSKRLLSRVRDRALEGAMKGTHRYERLRKIVDILRKQPLGRMPYRFLIRKGKEVGLQKKEKMSDLLFEFASCLEVYEQGGHRGLLVRQSKALLDILQEERQVKQEQTRMAVFRLRKLLMMSATHMIRLERISFVEEDLGLPDDFKESILQQHPQHFQLIQVDEWSPLVKLTSWDPALAIPVIEKKRQKWALKMGLSDREAKSMAYAFPVSYPPEFNFEKNYRSNMRKWQTLPYISPYEDATELDMLSVGASKRAVAVLHEYLHLTVEKKTKVKRFSQLREDFRLPQKGSHGFEPTTHVFMRGMPDWLDYTLGDLRLIL